MPCGCGRPEVAAAAVAERKHVTLLHYDSHYDLIAEVTGQAMQWAVERGTVP
jgi:predicted nucleic acid-binding protein